MMNISTLMFKSFTLTCSSWFGVTPLPRCRLPVDAYGIPPPLTCEPSCDSRTDPIPDPRLALLKSPSSPRPPLTEGTDVDRIRPAEPLPLKDCIFFKLSLKYWRLMPD